MGEDEGQQNSWKEAALHGQSPQDFIVGRVEDLRKFWEAQAKIDEKIAAEGPPTKYDYAYTVQLWIDQGVITEEEAGQAVSRFGLPPEESGVFISETMPEIREFMAEQRQKEAEEASRKQLEAAQKYTQQWGLERLDGVASYFQKNLGKLTPLNQYWGDSIKRYQTQRPKIEQELKQMTEPVQQARRLMRELYYLTFFHPSEAERIFRDEQDFGSYIFVDSLLEGSQVMYQTTSGKDPDFDSVHFGAGGIGVTATFYDYSKPEDVKRRQREDMMDRLVYGAKKPNEVRMPWSKQISKVNRMEEATRKVPK